MQQKMRFQADGIVRFFCSSRYSYASSHKPRTSPARKRPRLIVGGGFVPDQIQKFTNCFVANNFVGNKSIVSVFRLTAPPGIFPLPQGRIPGGFRSDTAYQSKIKSIDMMAG
jgi:hypothetical protein